MEIPELGVVCSIEYSNICVLRNFTERLLRSPHPDGDVRAKIKREENRTFVKVTYVALAIVCGCAAPLLRVVYDEGFVARRVEVLSFAYSVSVNLQDTDECK